MNNQPGKWDIEELKQNIVADHHIETIFRDVEKLSGNNGNFTGLCPFHDDKDPSLSITSKQGVILYHCFSCGASGDIFNYTMERYHKTFPEAVELIGDITGYRITESTIPAKPKPKKLPSDIESYLKKRGIKDFSGFSSEGDKILIQTFTGIGWGWIKHDRAGKPKYKNPSGQIVMPFNYWNCRGAGELWIFEGIFDALSFQQTENKNAVAIQSTSIKQSHIGYLKRFRTVILALDNDQAGKDGTIKAIHQLSREGINPYVVDYGQADFQYKDINEAYQAGDGDAVQRLMDNAKSGFKLIIDLNNPQDADLSDIEAGNRINNVKEYITGIEDRTEADRALNYYQDQYNLSLEYGVNLMREAIAQSEADKRIKSIVRDTEHIDSHALTRIKQVVTDYEIRITDQKELDFETYRQLNAEPDKPIPCSFIPEIGYHYGALTFIGARTGHGKTTYLINEAVLLARQNMNVNFISCEEGLKPISNKLSINWINRGNYTTSHFKNQELIAAKAFNQSPLDYIDQYKTELDTMLNRIKIHSGLTSIEKLENHITAINKVYGIDIFFIDYIQRLSISDNNRTRQEQIKEINARLLNLAIDLKLCLIMGAQFNRTVTEKRKYTSIYSYREAGDIEQDANLVINLWNNQKDDPNNKTLSLFVGKNRNGESNTEGCISTYFDRLIFDTHFTDEKLKDKPTNHSNKDDISEF